MNLTLWETSPPQWRFICRCAYVLSALAREVVCTFYLSSFPLHPDDRGATVDVAIAAGTFTPWSRVYHPAARRQRVNVNWGCAVLTISARLPLRYKARVHKINQVALHFSCATCSICQASSSFQRVVTVHCLAALNLGTGAGADTGGCRGCIPPTRPKEVLTWHLISLKIIAKNIFVLHIT